MLAVLGLFVLIQLIQPSPNMGLPTDEFNKLTNPPLNVDRQLRTSCYDCHSNNTRYPWYAHVQPFGWILSNHISEGKKDLNFDVFGTYSPRRQLSKLKSIQSSIEQGSMPLFSYTLLHPNASLSKEQKASIIQWTSKTIDSLSQSRK
jgi:hypothetical protein